MLQDYIVQFKENNVYFFFKKVKVGFAGKLQAENFSEIGQKESLLLQGFVQGSTEKAQCLMGLQPTGMDSRVEPKQMGNSIKVNTRSIWASVIKLWALLLALF